MTRHTFLAAAVAAVLALGACAAPTPPPEPGAATSAEASPATSSPPPSAPAATTPSPAAPAIAVARATPPAPTPPMPEPSRLKGLTGDEVQQLIGAPQFARADDPSALWRYRAGACLLDLYLHADGPVYRVTYFRFRTDPRGHGDARVDARACFAALLQAHQDHG